MKTGKVAKSFSVDPKTILNWTDNPLFRKYFSEEALGTSGQTQRDFTEADVLVLNTIRAERARNTDWQEIMTLLESGYRADEFPPSMLMVDSAAPIAQYGRVMTLIAERDAALVQVERLTDENQRKDETIGKLEQEIRKLNREIGKLEGKMESLEERLDEDK